MTTPDQSRFEILRPLELSVLVRIFTATLCLGLSAGAEPEQKQAPKNPESVPVRGLHLSAPAKKELAAAIEFIRESLPKEGVNALILEFDYNFDFQLRAEFADASALGKEEVQQIVKACREKGIELIPQINCLGHQSWAKRNGRLLQKHPEF